MVKSKSPKNILRKRLFGWLAFFLLLYTVADVSVLEYYCGNEGLGISSYSQVIVRNQKQTGSPEATFIAAEQSEPNHEAPNLPMHCDDCICSCAHVLTSNYQIEPLIRPVVYEQIHGSLPKFLISESHLQGFYRPPRIS